METSRPGADVDVATAVPVDPEAPTDPASPVGAPATAPTAAARRGGGVWKTVGRSAGVRLLVLPISAVLGIVITRLVIDNFGEASYTQYGLLVSLALLLPFADLGLGATLMNVVAESSDPGADPKVRAVLVSALRLLVGSAVVLLAIGGLVTVLGGWRTLLGDGLLPGGGSAAAAWCAALIAVAVPFGVGQRVLTGLGRNHVAVGVLGLQTPLVLLTVVVLVVSGGGGDAVAVSAYGATVVLSMGLTLLAARNLHPALGAAMRDAVHVRTVRGAPVFSSAWPMFVQMIVFPIAMQTDRVILSHVSDVTNMARYNFGSQIFTPVWQVVAAAGAALWPVFARQRAARAAQATAGGAVDPGAADPFRLAGWFGLAAGVVSGVLAFASPLLTDVATGGVVVLPVGLLVAFVAFMVVQAAKYPLGMYMTDDAGLRFQALMMAAMVPVNLGLSWWLGATVGAVGPVIGSVVGVALCQVAGPWLWIRRREARLHAAAVEPTGRVDPA